MSPLTTKIINATVAVSGVFVEVYKGIDDKQKGWGVGIIWGFSYSGACYNIIMCDSCDLIGELLPVVAVNLLKKADQ